MPNRYHWVLFFHLVGVVVFFSGAAVAAVGLETARRRERASEIALLLGVARRGVALVGIGLVIVVAFGVWLVGLGDWGWSRGWISGSLALLGMSAVAGAIGGREARKTRRLAETLAAEGREQTPELRRLLDDRLARALNYGSGVFALAVLALMVLKPGG